MTKESWLVVAGLAAFVAWSEMRGSALSPEAHKQIESIRQGMDPAIHEACTVHPNPIACHMLENRERTIVDRIIDIDRANTKAKQAGNSAEFKYDKANDMVEFQGNQYIRGDQF